MAQLMTLLGSLLGGFMQSTAGFGFSVVFMMLVPPFLGIKAAGSVSSMTNVPLNLILFVRYRKYIRGSRVWLPTLAYIIASSLAIEWLADVDVTLLRRIFGVFLLILAAYYIFGKDRVKVKANAKSAILCGVLSGLSGGLFTIGGPLMSLYFIDICDSWEEYIGSLNFLFLTSSLLNTISRAFNGLVDQELMPFVIIAVLGMLIGQFVGTKAASKIPTKTISYLIYALIILSGMNALIG